MGGEVERYRGTVSVRSYSKAVERSHRGAGLSLARIDDEVAVQEGVIQGVGALTSTAYKEVTMLSQQERQYAQLVPDAAPRLQAIGDCATLAIVGVVMDAPRRFNRAR